MRRIVWAWALVLAAGGGAVRGDESKAKPAAFDVTVALDVPYTGEADAGERHRLDVYMPKGRKDFPVFFFIHGGGWRNGAKDGFARHGLAFAKNGIGFVAINYRLSPKVKHPEHIKDVARAFAWTVRNVGKYGGRPDAIFVGGHSAGGHLAALLGTDESYLKAEKLSLKDVRGVVPISGVFDVGGNRMEAVFGDEEARKQASPQTHVRAKLPPMLILYADKEMGALGKQADAFGKALTGAKSDAVVKVIKDRNHGTIMARIAREDDPATKLIFEFIARNAGTKSTGAGGAR